jgi:Protein of unknown function (DUF1329)
MDKALRFCVATLLTLAAVYFLPSAAVALQDGEVLGPDTWEEAQGLLPEEILDHYRKGEYVNQVADIRLPGYRSTALPQDFHEASRANRGLYALSPGGSIIESRSGQQPRYIFGLPFPDVDRNDPQAGTKIVWNSLYSTWYNGNYHFLTELVMLSRHGIDRRLTTDVQALLYDGSFEARDLPNPNNLQSQMVARVVAPADMNGTVSLTWRYRDPDKPDSMWTFVPGLRKPRQVSPLNRSDGFLGSDISIDDGPFFDGKPEDFTFRLLEQRDQLVIMDPFSIRNDAEIIPVAGGGWRILWKDVPRIGADDPSWKGLPWAPVNSVLVRRPVWIVEATPRDPNYLYGRMLLRFDAETYQGSFVSKYDRAGTLLMSYQASTGGYYTIDGDHGYIPAGGTSVRTGENFLYNRATVVLFPPRKREHPADYRVPLTPELFNIDALVRLGK